MGAAVRAYLHVLDPVGAARHPQGRWRKLLEHLQHLVHRPVPDGMHRHLHGATQMWCSVAKM
jgi:hypothetical protein